MSDLIIGQNPRTENVVSLSEDDDTLWECGIAMCEICRHVWLSQAHIDAVKNAIECPKCKRFRSYFIPQMMIKQLFDAEETE